MIVVYHDVYSLTKLLEFVRIVLAYKPELLVISRAQGQAAQTGIPEASKKAFQKGVRFLVVKDLPDLWELLGKEEYLVFTRDADEVFDPKKHKAKVLVFCGTEPTADKVAREGGVPVKVEPCEMGELGFASIALWMLRGKRI